MVAAPPIATALLTFRNVSLVMMFFMVWFLQVLGRTYMLGIKLRYVTFDCVQGRFDTD